MAAELSRAERIIARTKLAVVELAMVVCVMWIASEIYPQAPVQYGEAAAFWEHACTIDPNDSNEFRKRWGGCSIYPQQGEWCFYYDQWIHGQPLYRVRAETVASYLEDVVAAYHRDPKSVRRWVRSAFAAWERLPQDERTSHALQQACKDAWISSYDDPKMRDYCRDCDRWFPERWAYCQRYPARVIFEMVWACVVILFIATPWLRRAGPLGWGFHVGLLPMVILLPGFLGYVDLTFLGSYPPQGVVYPYVVWQTEDVVEAAGLDHYAGDGAALNFLPRPLERLSVSEPWLNPTDCVSVGPVSTLMFAMVVGGIVAAFGLMGRITVRRGKDFVKSVRESAPPP